MVRNLNSLSLYLWGREKICQIKSIANLIRWVDFWFTLLRNKENKDKGRNFMGMLRNELVFMYVLLISLILI